MTAKTKDPRLIVDMNRICRTNGRLPIIDYNEFESTLSTEERLRVLDKIDECRERGDEEEMDKWYDKIPLAPHIAIGMLHERCTTIEEILEYNLADVEKCFGKDWIERFKPTPAEKAKKNAGDRSWKPARHDGR